MFSRFHSRFSNKPSLANRTLSKSSVSQAEECVHIPLGTREKPESPASEISFAVDSVTPAEKPVWSETLADSLARRFQRKVLILPEAQKQVINSPVDSLYQQTSEFRSGPALTDERRATLARQLGSRCHPFIDAVHIAFSQHRPLILSPDAIWLLIAQGFSHHVAENAETLRPRLVRHQGKRELQVKVFDLTLSSFQLAIENFSSLIQQETDPVLHETLICDFSTTRPEIRTASEVVLMDCFSSYFTYAMMCVCGIPKITVEGTLTDWQRIRARVEVLATYGLEWWVSRLRPILDEFVRTAEGHPSLEFWKAIYKPKEVYGGEVVTGWVADLFPYLGDAPARRRSHVFNHERRGWALSVDQGVETKAPMFDPLAKAGVGLKGFPSGLSSARLKVSLNDGSRQELDLVAGFLAVQQDLSDLALAPHISWCVAELPPQEPVLVR